MENRKLKILHVLKSSMYSGAENVAIMIIENLQKEMELAYVATDGTIREVLEERRVPYYLLENYTRNNIKAVIYEFQPDIIHAHDFTATILCASIHGKFRLISHLHYDPPWVKYWNIKTILFSVCRKRVDKLIVVSQVSYNNMVFKNLFSDKKTIMLNPVDKNRILSMSMEESVEESYDLLYVGRLVEQKNPQKFIRIVDMLKKRNIQVKSAMIGEGDLRGKCLQLIQEKGLKKEIKLLGYKRNPYFYMKRSKIICMTSRWEGYGLVVIEANMLGVPILSTRATGVQDILGKDAEELCDSEEEFCEKIVKLLFDRNQYDYFVQRAIERAGKVVSLSKYMEDIRELYLSVMEGKEYVY